METEIRYSRTGGTAIAYQVLGNGETDLVYVPGYMSNLVFAWQYPRWRDFYLRLAQSFRLILFDSAAPGCLTTAASSRRWRRGWRTCTPCSTRPALRRQ